MEEPCKAPSSGLGAERPEVNAFCGEKAPKKLRTKAAARRPFIIHVYIVVGLYLYTTKKKVAAVVGVEVLDAKFG